MQGEGRKRYLTYNKKATIDEKVGAFISSKSFINR